MEVLHIMKFLRGEIRNVEFEVISCENADFNISTASVEVYRDKFVKTIPCVINQHSISFSFDTNDFNDRYYTIIVTISIGTEIIKRKRDVEIEDVWV